MQVIARRYLKLENANATRTARSDYAKIYRPGGADGRTGGTVRCPSHTIHSAKTNLVTRVVRAPVLEGTESHRCLGGQRSESPTSNPACRHDSLAQSAQLMSGYSGEVKIDEKDGQRVHRVLSNLSAPR